MRPSSCPDQVIGVQCEVLDRWIPSNIERPDIHSFNMRREDLLGPESSLAGSQTIVLVYLSYRYCRFNKDTKRDEGDGRPSLSGEFKVQCIRHCS